MKNFTSKSLIYIIIAAFTLVLIISLMSSYNVIIGEDPFDSNISQVMLLALTDMVSVSVLTIFFARKIYGLFASNKNQKAPSSLQKKIIFIFGGIAAIPAIIIAILSTFILNIGINSWFNDKIESAMDSSIQAVAAALNEHQNFIKSDALSVAEKVNFLEKTYDISKNNLSEFLTSQAEEKSLSEAIIFEDDPFSILAMSRLSLPFTVSMLPNNAIELAKKNFLIIPEADRVRILIKLEQGTQFLLISRLIDPQLLSHYERVQGVVGEYRRLNTDIKTIEITFSLIFVSVSTVVLIAAIAFGIYYASYITSPIIALVQDIGKIKEGNFAYRIKAKNNDDEIGLLSKSFNLMLGRIQKQHNDLLAARDEIQERKVFIEAVLEGVPAGVIALDRNYSVKLLNKKAVEMLLLKRQVIIDKNIKTTSPEIKAILDKLISEKLHSIEQQIKINSLSDKTIVNVKIIAEESGDKGFIITLDDVTALVAAERSNAWSDIARKIAHEVKNPLTPISLAANRLVNKFIEQVDDKEAFKKYIDTINKYIVEISRLIDEFINYAKLNGSKMSKLNIISLIKDSVSHFNSLIQGVKVEFISNNDDIFVKADGAQIGQVIMNLLKNSMESIKIANIKDGSIKIELQNLETYVMISVRDNGPGFDPNILDKITTPYLTTKEGGTGLGLAIVKKILDDHGASLEFSNIKNGGALVRIKLNKILEREAI